MSDERKWEPDNRQAEGSPGANENRENIQNEQDTRNAQKYYEREEYTIW